MSKQYPVETLHEAKRGCGFRKPSKDGVGIYLMGTGVAEPCERMPFPLQVCPVCGEGIRFFRGFRWVNPTRLFAPNIEPICKAYDIINDVFNIHPRDPHHHEYCAICNPRGVAGEKAGLMWIGKKFYTPTGFIKEAITRGISKKINAVPKDFILGEHWIYLAHQEAVQTSKLKESEQNGQKVLNGTKQENGFKSGIFYIFKHIACRNFNISICSALN